MNDASITIHLDEFDDILGDTVDDLVRRHGEEIATHLRSFLIGIATVEVVTSTGRRLEWRC